MSEAYRPAQRSALLLCGLAVSLLGCSDVLTSASTPDLRDLALEPNETLLPALRPGDSLALNVVGRDGRGMRQGVARGVTYASGDLRVATISSNGVVRALAPGYVRVSATVATRAGVQEVARRIDVVPMSRVQLEGTYSLTAVIEQSDPAWGIEPDTYQSAIVKIAQPAGGLFLRGWFSDFCAVSPSGQTCNSIIGEVRGTVADDSTVTVALTFQGSTSAYWSGTGKVTADGIIAGRFFAGGHISGRFRLEQGW